MARFLIKLLVLRYSVVPTAAPQDAHWMKRIRKLLFETGCSFISNLVDEHFGQAVVAIKILIRGNQPSLLFRFADVPPSTD